MIDPQHHYICLTYHVSYDWSQWAWRITQYSLRLPGDALPGESCREVAPLDQSEITHASHHGGMFVCTWATVRWGAKDVWSTQSEQNAPCCRGVTVGMTEAISTPSEQLVLLQGVCKMFVLMEQTLDWLRYVVGTVDDDEHRDQPRLVTPRISGRLSPAHIVPQSIRYQKHSWLFQAQSKTGDM